MKNIFLTAILAIAILPVSAQTFFPMKKGAVLEYRYYDDKGKPLRDQWRNERWTRLTVEDTWGDSIANIVINNETFERLKGVESLRETIEGISYGDVHTTPGEVVFENVLWLFMLDGLSQVSADLDEMLKHNEMRKAMSEGKTTVTLSATASLPRELHVGDVLPDVRYEAVYKEEAPEEYLAKRQDVMNSVKETISQINLDAMNIDESTRATLEAVMGMDLSKPAATTQTAMISNRRVVAFEKVGNYDCWKITYRIAGPTEHTPGRPRFKIGANGIPELDQSPPAITDYIDYISPEVGLVKREKLNFRGNKVEEVVELKMVND